MSIKTEIPFIKIFKKSWVNSEETIPTWTQVFRFLVDQKDLSEEDRSHFAAIGAEYASTVTELVEPQLKKLEQLSLAGFVALIYDTELYTQYMKEPYLTKDQTIKLLETFNELSMERSLSLDIMETTTTSSTTATGPALAVDVPELDASNKEDTEIEDIDTIVRSLAPALGLSTTGSICSSISIQQNGALCQLKYPETNGYAIIEVNLARCSKVADLDSREAWKAYDFRTKIVVPAPTHHIHILAMKLIRNITDNLKKRKDGKKTTFQRKALASSEEDEAGPSHRRLKARKRTRF